MLADVVEYKLKNNPRSTAWKEFIKDVKSQLKGKLKYSRGVNPETLVRKAQEKAALNAKLSKIAYIIQDAASQAFPDGDPLDIIMGKMRRLGIDTNDVMDWLNKAAKHALGVKDYNTYMANIYDDYAADNPEQFIDSGIFFNPYSNMRFNFINHLKTLFKHSKHTNVIIEIIYLSNIKPNAESIKAINDNKEIIIKSLLTTIKNLGHVSKYTMKLITKLKSWGIDWPEFAALSRSYEGSK